VHSRLGPKKESSGIFETAPFSRSVGRASLPLAHDNKEASHAEAGLGAGELSSLPAASNISAMQKDVPRDVAQVAGKGSVETQPEAGVSATTGEMLRSGVFWMLFLQFLIGSGACLAFLNNVGQLVEALGGEHDGQVALVSLFSVANAVGGWAQGT